MGKTIDCLLIRHGKTQGNIEHRYIGSGVDQPLCEEGIRALCEERDQLPREAGEGLLFVSPMLRARMTAEILFPDRPQIVIPELTEMSFGEFEGKSADEMEHDPAYNKWIESNGTIAFPGGESRAEFEARSLRAFLETIRSYAGETDRFVFVFHGGNIMSVMCHFTGKGYFDFIAENGECILLKLEVSEDDIHLLSYNRIFGGYPV